MGKAKAQLLGTGEGKRKTSSSKWGFQQRDQIPSFDHLPGGLGLAVSSLMVAAVTLHTKGKVNAFLLLLQSNSDVSALGSHWRTQALVFLWWISVCSPAL